MSIDLFGFNLTASGEDKAAMKDQLEQLKFIRTPPYDLDECESIQGNPRSISLKKIMTEHDLAC